MRLEMDRFGVGRRSLSGASSPLPPPSECRDPLAVHWCVPADEPGRALVRPMALEARRRGGASWGCSGDVAACEGRRGVDRRGVRGAEEAGLLLLLLAG